MSAHPLVRRQRAVEQTQARFFGKAFAWGSVDCGRMVAFHLRRLGRPVRLSKAGPYRTAAGAAAALARLGYASLPEAMDGHGFARIAPAYALIGDVVSFASDHAIGAMGIVVGNGNMLAFHEAHELPVIMSMGRIDSAWQVI